MPRRRTRSAFLTRTSEFAAANRGVCEHAGARRRPTWSPPAPRGNEECARVQHRFSRAAGRGGAPADWPSTRIWSSAGNRVSRSNCSSNLDPGGEPAPARARTRGAASAGPPGDHSREDRGNDRRHRCAVLIQSIMPSTRPGQPEVRDRRGTPRATCPAGVHALRPITRQLAETKGHSTLPHQRDHTMRLPPTIRSLYQ